MKTLLPCAGLFISACLLTGCGGSDRYAITGTVTFKDQPLKEGIVLFEPLDKQDTAGSVMLAEGKYSIPRENGLKPGKYRVRITAGDGKTAVNPVNPDEPPGPGGGANVISKELIPASWNTQSKQEVTVKPENPNTINFDIK